MEVDFEDATTIMLKVVAIFDFAKFTIQNDMKYIYINMRIRMFFSNKL